MASKALDLSIRKAVPKIGTTVRIDKRQENPPGYAPFYYLIPTVYNEGELPAKQLQGQCKLLSSTKQIEEHEIPISRDFLGSSPYELERCRLNSRINGAPIDLGAEAGKDTSFNVDIELSYFGIPDDQPCTYQAQYEYDRVTRQMKRVR